MAKPQFGDPHPSLIYRDRPAAFGVLETRWPGRAGCDREARPRALARPAGRRARSGRERSGGDDSEFGEETGLSVAAGETLGRRRPVLHQHRRRGYNNRQTLFEARLLGEAPELKIETDHTLVWLPLLEAVARLWQADLSECLDEGLQLRGDGAVTASQ